MMFGRCGGVVHQCSFTRSRKTTKTPVHGFFADRSRPQREGDLQDYVWFVEPRVPHVMFPGSLASRLFARLEF